MQEITNDWPWETLPRYAPASNSMWPPWVTIVNRYALNPDLRDRITRRWETSFLRSPVTWPLPNRNTRNRGAFAERDVRPKHVPARLSPGELDILWSIVKFNLRPWIKEPGDTSWFATKQSTSARHSIHCKKANMALDPRKRQKKLERQEGQGTQGARRDAPRGTIDRFGQSVAAPIHECVHSADLWEEGIGWVMISSGGYRTARRLRGVSGRTRVLPGRQERALGSRRSAYL